MTFCTGPHPTQCETAYLQAIQQYQRGRYVPRCTRDGEYEAIQMHEEDHFCVDAQGVEVLGTRVKKPFRPECKVPSKLKINIINTYLIKLQKEISNSCLLSSSLLHYF